MQTRSVYVLVTLSALFWGANFVLAGPVLIDEPPLWAAALRFIFGGAILLGLAMWRKQDLIAPARAHYMIYLLLGGIGIATFNLLFFTAMQHTSAANGALIMATNPLLTTILAAVLLGERAGLRQIAALPLALAGVIVVITGGHLQRLAGLQVSSGDLLMLGANLAWAIYNILGRRYLPPASTLANTTLVMLAGALILTVIAGSSHETLVLPGPVAASALAGMTVCGSVLAYLFWTTGIKRLGAGRTALFLNLVPVFAMLIGVLTGILPGIAQLIGGALVIGGVSVATLPRRAPVRTTPCKTPA